MKTMKFATTLGTVASLGAMVLVLTTTSHVKAESEESLSKKGLRLAPVPLNLQGKNPELVGYGSYLVNVVSECNGCHVSSPAVAYAPGGNPYLGQTPAKVNPDTYLGGGRDFGQLIPGTANIISRNLTPDKTGLPAGGMKFSTFREIMKTGLDDDKLHPTCSGAPNANCLLPPFDGSKLQIMPWPAFSKMSEYDLRAIYAYLSAIPCIGGPPAPSTLHHDCQ